jgi:glutamate transport system permease protein
MPSSTTSTSSSTGSAPRSALTLLSAVGALLLGTLIAAMRVSPVPPLRWAGTLYVNLVRNTPLTVVFFLVVFGLPEVGVIISFYRFAVIALSLYTAAFVAEAVRSGINSVAAGQAEASRSVGMTFGQTLRLVVLPQAFANVIPPLASVFIALLKNTSIAFAFGIFEGTQAMYKLANANGNAVIGSWWRPPSATHPGAARQPGLGALERAVRPAVR